MPWFRSNMTAWLYEYAKKHISKHPTRKYPTRFQTILHEPRKRKRRRTADHSRTADNRLTVSETVSIDERAGGYMEMVEYKNSARGHLIALETIRRTIKRQGLIGTRRQCM